MSCSEAVEPARRRQSKTVRHHAVNKLAFFQLFVLFCRFFVVCMVYVRYLHSIDSYVKNHIQSWARGFTIWGTSRPKQIQESKENRRALHASCPRSLTNPTGATSTPPSPNPSFFDNHETERNNPTPCSTYNNLTSDASISIKIGA